MHRRTLELPPQQRAELEDLRDHADKPYLRERAAALLKIANGESPVVVARFGLLKPHKPDTVYEWLNRYEAEGVSGLYIRPGRGRKAVFSPLTPEAAHDAVEWVLHQSPWRYGIRRARWRLQDVGRAIAWLDGVSEPGIYKVLKRLGFSRKQALSFIHSPDPEYHAKWRAILQAYKEAVERPDEVVILFQDEMTYYRQPSQAPAYHRRGKGQPRARQASRSNTQTRIAAALNGMTGQVTYIQRNKVGAAALVSFYEQICAAYPEAKVIYLVQDNWPVHKLPEVLQAAAAQRLTPLFLPTYATWLNPIEKLWRWLKQEVLHLHELAHDLPRLRQRVCDFLDQFGNGSDALLHYVGLLPD